MKLGPEGGTKRNGYLILKYKIVSNDNNTEYHKVDVKLSFLYVIFSNRDIIREMIKKPGLVKKMKSMCILDTRQDVFVEKSWIFSGR